MTFKDLLAYKKAFALAMEIYEKSKSFPKNKTYSLTDQVRRSSRSTAINIAEAYAKRRYQKHFISKLTDSDAENLETQEWLAFSFSCGYIDKDTLYDLTVKSNEIGKLIYFMMNHPEKFGSKKDYS